MENRAFLEASENDFWPNLILVSMDAVRPDHLSAYGYLRTTTPHLTEMAREGLLFTQAVATSCWTLPSHASILTGLYTFGHGASFRYSRIKEGVISLARWLKARGYSTAAVVSAPYLMGRFGLKQGFDLYDDGMPAKGKKTALDVNQTACRWLENNHQSPFFLFLHYFDAHTPYVPPAPYNTLYDPDYQGLMSGEHFAHGERVLKEQITLGQEDRQHLIALYDGAIAYQDEQLGRLFKILSGLGHTRDTIWAFTSDHGEAFGEHNLWLHGHSLYEEMLRIPLIIYYPRLIPIPNVISSQVSQADLMPTLLDMMGFPVPEQIHGKSHWPLNPSQESGSSIVFGHVDRFPYLVKNYGPRFDRDLWSIRTESRKYIRSSRGETELYDLTLDPGEMENQAHAFPEETDYYRHILEEVFFKNPSAGRSFRGWLNTLFKSGIGK
jgi:arylsulfatase A-like enzyme